MTTTLREQLRKMTGEASGPSPSLSSRFPSEKRSSPQVIWEHPFHNRCGSSTYSDSELWFSPENAASLRPAHPLGAAHSLPFTVHTHPRPGAAPALLHCPGTLPGSCCPPSSSPPHSRGLTPRWLPKHLVLQLPLQSPSSSECPPIQVVPSSASELTMSPSSLGSPRRSQAETLISPSLNSTPYDSGSSTCGHPCLLSLF